MFFLQLSDFFARILMSAIKILEFLKDFPHVRLFQWIVIIRHNEMLARTERLSGLENCSL